MRKTARILTLAAISLMVLLVITLAAASWWLGRQFTPERLVSQIRTDGQASLSIGSSKLSLWTFPASLRIGAIELKPSTPVEGNTQAALLKIDELLLEVSLSCLLKRTLDVKTLHLHGLQVREYVSPEGQSQWQQSLGKKKSEPSLAEAPESDESAQQQAEPGQVKKSEEARRRPATFHADQLGLSIRIHEARISDADIFIHNRVNKTKTRLENLQFALTEIDIDPADLKNHNLAKLDLLVDLTSEGRGKVGGEMRDVTFAKLRLEGGGEVQPFDADTGALDPLSKWLFTVKKGSKLAGYMTMGEADAAANKKLAQLGLDLSDLPIGGELLEDALIRTVYQSNRLTFLEDARFQMPEYEVSLAAGSWINGAEDQQDLKLRLHCGQTLDERLSQRIRSAGLGEKLSTSLLSAMQDESSQRISLEVRASGQMTKPKISPAWEPILDKLIQQDAVPDLLKGFLK
jgi:hypothetical protein